MPTYLADLFSQVLRLLDVIVIPILNFLATLQCVGINNRTCWDFG